MVSGTFYAVLNSWEFTLRVGEWKGKHDQPFCAVERPLGAIVGKFKTGVQKTN